MLVSLWLHANTPNDLQLAHLTWKQDQLSFLPSDVDERFQGPWYDHTSQTCRHDFCRYCILLHSWAWTKSFSSSHLTQCDRHLNLGEMYFRRCCQSLLALHQVNPHLLFGSFQQEKGLLAACCGRLSAWGLPVKGNFSQGLVSGGTHRIAHFLHSCHVLPTTGPHPVLDRHRRRAGAHADARTVSAREGPLQLLGQGPARTGLRRAHPVEPAGLAAAGCSLEACARPARPGRRHRAGTALHRLAAWRVGRLGGRRRGRGCRGNCSPLPHPRLAATSPQHAPASRALRHGA